MDRHFGTTGPMLPRSGFAKFSRNPYASAPTMVSTAQQHTLYPYTLLTNRLLPGVALHILWHISAVLQSRLRPSWT